jgi:hypothetical protein
LLAWMRSPLQELAELMQILTVCCGNLPDFVYAEIITVSLAETPVARSYSLLCTALVDIHIHLCRTFLRARPEVYPNG